MRSLALAIRFLMFGLVASSVPARGANFTFSAAKGGGVAILMEGEIVEGDASHLRGLMENVNRSRRSLARLLLNSPGGNLDQGFKIALEIKRQLVATEVPKGASCASACFLIFAAGPSKFVGRGARVGVHGASDQRGKETSNSAAITVGMARWAVKELGVPSEIIGKMVVTPPNSIIWLSSEELHTLGAVETDEDFIASSDASAPGSSNRVVDQVEASNNAWSELMSDALALSKAAHNGEPDLRENCRAETQTCRIALFFKRSNGARAMIRSTRDARGKVVRRHYCEFREDEAVWACTDWDSHVVAREKESGEGAWRPVSAP